VTIATAGRDAARGTRVLRALRTAGTVRPGFSSTFLELSLSILPRWGRVFVLSRMMAGMTKHSAT
jgi:hypothetical protein